MVHRLGSDDYVIVDLINENIRNNLETILWLENGKSLTISTDFEVKEDNSFLYIDSDDGRISLIRLDSIVCVFSEVKI